MTVAAVVLGGLGSLPGRQLGSDLRPAAAILAERTNHGWRWMRGSQAALKPRKRFSWPAAAPPCC